MKYPIKCNWISYKEKLSDDGCYTVSNFLSETEMQVPGEIISFIEKLDGKHDPYMLLKNRMKQTEVRQFLVTLELYGLIRQSKTIVHYFGTWMHTLLILKNNSRYRTAAKVINGMLIYGILPLLVMMIYSIRIIVREGLYRDMFNSLVQLYLGFISAVIIGGLMHEIGHAAAGISYGASVMEIGIMFRGFPGAYTMMDDKPIKSRLDRVQTFLAGIEVNLVLTCIAVILIVFIPGYLSFLTEFALINLEFTLTNILMINGFDGMAVMGLILGDEELLENVKKLMRSPLKRKRLKRKGISGRVRLMTAYIIYGTRVFYLFFILANIAILWEVAIR